MSIRCAICGSKRVTLETKNEGYDLKKGIIGQAVIGIPGALAGMNGKENLYYHCADCGQVMNKPMLSVESDWIDKLLENPDGWNEQLKEKKAKYKNIEWDEKNNNKYISEKSNLSYEERVLSIENEVIEKLIEIGAFL